jgi:hypothetical protein
MTITLKRCALADIEAAPNLPALLDEYGRESSIDGLGAQNMQGDTYRALESTGLLHIVGAWAGDELAGFIAVLVSVLPHYGKTVCVSESYFVAAAHRKTGAGLLLLKEAERIGEEHGAAGFLLSAPMGGRLASVLPAKGYRQTNQVFFKPLCQVAAPIESLPAMTGEAVDKVREAEAKLLNLPQVDIPVHHNLHAGMYARTITIPAGVAITGALIKIPTILIVDGHCEVFTGAESVVMTGYHVLQASAHRKQVFLAYSDTTMTMLFPTAATTVEQAENEFTDEAALLWSRRPENQGEHKCLAE